MTMDCGPLEYVFISDAKHFIHNTNGWFKCSKKFGLEKKNEDPIKGSTSKGHGGKVASLLLLYHLVKRFAIVRITRKIIVNYLLIFYRKQLSWDFQK